MRVSKWGNSLAVRLPKNLVEELAIKAGDELAIIDATKARLSVAKDAKRRRALDVLMSINAPLPADYKFDRDEANSR